jgi:hypothetical protein
LRISCFVILSLSKDLGSAAKENILRLTNCTAKILRRQKKLAPRRSRAKRDGFVFAPSFFLSKSKPLL